jgi:hypothetical protein
MNFISSLLCKLYIFIEMISSSLQLTFPTILNRLASMPQPRTLFIWSCTCCCLPALFISLLCLLFGCHTFRVCHLRTVIIRSRMNIPSWVAHSGLKSGVVCNLAYKLTKMKFPLRRHVNLDTKPFVLAFHSRFLGVRFILCQPRLHNRIFMNIFLKISHFLDSKAWEILRLCFAQLLHILTGILEILINQFSSRKQS